MDLTTKQVQAAKWLKEALEGNVDSKHKLAEGISTSDIPVQLTPTLSYIALGAYNEVIGIWPDFASREVVQDFQSNPYMSFEFGDEDIEAATAGIRHIEGGLANIPEYDEYPVLRLTASEFSISTRKNGVQIKFSWESLYKTRNFGILKRTFEEFGKRAKRTEDIEASKILVNATGINTTHWKAANQNVLAGNPELSMDALEAAFKAVALQTGKNGVRITAPAKYNLVVAPSLATVAAQILAVTEIEVQVTGAGGKVTKSKTGNPVAGKIGKVVENTYLPQIAGATADKAWFLVPVPGSTPNPAVVNVFLEGEEGPKVFVQRTTNSAPEDGAFIDDSYSTKTRHVVAGGFIDPAGTIASNGSGS